MKSLLKIAIFATFFLAANSAMALVATTKHNLAGTADDDNDQICVYCHAPHTASTDTSPPLWNKNDPTTLYTMYTSDTMDMLVNSQKPGPESLVCLSCHDGTVAMDSIINTPQSGWTLTNTKMATGVTGYMGTDLRSEHPIGVTYDNTTGANGDPDFDSIANATADNIVFYGGSTDQVECASCHSVHDYLNVPFLRLSNANSALCLACHVK
jgi:predicted CXXCH cytochrome family protein